MEFSWIYGAKNGGVCGERGVKSEDMAMLSGELSVKVLLEGARGECEVGVIGEVELCFQGILGRLSGSSVRPIPPL